MHMHTWLLAEGLPSLPVRYYDLVKDVGCDVMDSYPYKEVEICLNWRITSTPSHRLVADNPEYRFAGFQTMSGSIKRTHNMGALAVDAALHYRIMGQVVEASVATIFLLINFLNAQWCCLVIKVQAKRIYRYVLLNQASFKNPCMTIATHRKISGLQDYAFVSQNNPVSFNAFSSGVYVCWVFVRIAIQGLKVDIADKLLPRRRFKLCYCQKTAQRFALDPTMASVPPATDD
ncbi:hypothetical protein PHMEG_0006872 [Phytophthora megakarya]|uniref:Uncharacterized protein n=1 Tax=Phytophthora megakarya TaxID=4795 RepID=A0A225WPN5_9STRA|nr:hypothetical protein PHMEG_0006872 [Phytophthora megakarya]